MSNMNPENSNADIAGKGNLFSDSSSESQESADFQGTASMDSQLEYLKSIDSTLKDLLKTGQTISQSDAMNAKQGQGSKKGGKFGAPRKPKNFAEGLQDALLESVLGPGFKDQMRAQMNGLAKAFGVELQDLPGELGKQVGNSLVKNIKNTKLGGSVFSRVENRRDKMFGNLQNAWNRGVSDARAKQSPSEDTKEKEAERNEANKAAANRAASDADFNKAKDSDKSSNNSKDVVNSLKNQAEGKIKDKVKGKIKDTLTDLVSEGAESPGEALASQAADAASSAATSAETVEAVSGTAEAVEVAEAAEIAGGTAEVASGLAGTTEAMAGLTAVAAEVIPYVAAVAIVLELISPLLEGLGKLLGALKSSGNRDNETRKKYAELERKRMEADIEAIIVEPFNILKDAANAVYDAWDKNVRLINGTQGYSKADLQDLMSIYAQRLRDEGLTKVISGADITESLATVLQAGLSGKVAEEFAYQATKLNAAVPTQDFFGYASTYASLAANAIKNGASEADAIAYATRQLDLFASGVLFANRQLTGGFTTGLKDAQSIFEQSVKIAQTSRTNDPAGIANVMTAVSAVVGAIAPDLASSMTDAVYRAATGGNDSSLVALRSLAGINASNTEFLRAVAANPQKVFADLFTALAERQNMSNSAYMEVAEGLSNIFGVSMDAFARVDFNYLADAISSMKLGVDALGENVELLASGETTLTPEQLKMQQINEYMLDEGLSYVLDNQVARSIQEHMWDEQMKREIIEAEYGVNIHGAALDFLEGLKHTVSNILDFLNPLGWLFKTLNNIASTGVEAYEQDKDIKRILEATNVGSAKDKALYQLTTRNQNLQLVADYPALLGVASGYQSARNGRVARNKAFEDVGAALMGGILGGILGGPIGIVAGGLLGGAAGVGISGAQDWAQRGASYSGESVSDFSNGPKASSVDSLYRWRSLSKSTSTAVFNAVSQGVEKAAMNSAQTSAQAAADTAQAYMKDKVDKMVGDMKKAIEEEKSYDEWVKTASKYGISDFKAAIDAAGYKENQLKSQFESEQTGAGKDKKLEREAKEEKFWEDLQLNSDSSMSQLIVLTTLTNTLLTENNEWLHKINSMQINFRDVSWKGFINGAKGWIKFYDHWVDYFVKHVAYNVAVSGNKKGTISTVSKIQTAEKKDKETAIYALAEALVKNTVDLKDPTVQTNALLADILIIVKAIMQQNTAAASNSTLSDMLGALALGK